MPRKYHRPPTTKRRKSKKTSSPNVLEPLPESQTDHSGATVEDEDEAAEEYGEPVETEEYVDEDDEVYEAAPAQVAAAAKKARPVRHLVADYTYVLTEIKLSIALAIFLIVALAITAIFR